MSSTSLSFSTIHFFGRPYAELLKCFGLNESDLVGRSVLECPSGPSSFVAEASLRGIDAVGVDPLFYRGPEAIAALARADFRAMFAKVKASPEQFVRRTYGSVAEAEAARRAGLERFLEDYAVGRALGRYRMGALPRLEFEDRAFDYALCGHLLFLYEDLLGERFHETATRELCRVARREVRIHPVVDAGNGRPDRLDAVMAAAEASGFAAGIERVEHSFFRGTDRTLVLRRRESV